MLNQPKKNVVVAAYLFGIQTNSIEKPNAINLIFKGKMSPVKYNFNQPIFAFHKVKLPKKIFLLKIVAFFI